MDLLPVMSLNIFPNKITFERILPLAFLLSVSLLALSKVFNYDAWLHLSLGREIYNLRALPLKEPFAYPLSGKPFFYTSWLFALLYYLSFHFFNVYGIVLLKTITVCTAFYILLKDSLRPYKNSFIAVFVLTFVVIITRSRFVERPDSFLMVFLPFSIFALNAYLYDSRKYLYALPFIHCLWANSHSSINLMFIPFLAFLAAGVLQQYLDRKGLIASPCPTKSQLKTVTLIFAASVAASLINPNFIRQFTYGAVTLSDPWFKRQIQEFYAPTWQTGKPLFLMIATAALSCLLNIRRLSLFHVLILIPFAALSLTAMRFILIFAITAGPIVARNLSAYFDAREKWRKLSYKNAGGAIILVWIVLYTLLALAKVSPFAVPGMEFGFGFNSVNVPEGALKYMDKKEITGRVFNQFAWGQYITWRDFPKRTPFIDGRTYLSADSFEKAVGALEPGSLLLEDLYHKYGFEAVLIEYPSVSVDLLYQAGDVDFAMPDPGWALVYWDDLSLLYLKKGGKYQSVIETDEYRLIRPANDIAGFSPRLHDNAFVKELAGELRQNIDETGSARAYRMLGFLYNETGLYQASIDSFSRAIASPAAGDLSFAYKEIAYAYSRLGDTDKAVSYCRKSLGIREDAGTHYGLGSIYLQKGETDKAIKHLTRALQLKSGLMEAYKPLIYAYQRLGMQKKVQETVGNYEKAKILAEAEKHFETGLRAYAGGSYERAIEEFRKTIATDPSHAKAYNKLGSVYFNLGRLDEARGYQERAVALDPDFEGAHYELALVCKKLGDMEKARLHWKEYLRIEPAGFFAAKAEEEIKNSYGEHSP